MAPVAPEDWVGISALIENQRVKEKPFDLVQYGVTSGMTLQQRLRW